MFNQSILYGRLTANPEVRQTQSGSLVCSFTVAVDRPKSKDGNQTADFIKCACWNGTAEMISKYFRKGKPIMVTGRIQNNDYTDKNGIKHYSYVVLVNNVSFSINDNGQNQSVEGSQNSYAYNSYANVNTSTQGGYSANRVYQQAPPLPCENVNDDYETILSDGELPF